MANDTDSCQNRPPSSASKRPDPRALAETARRLRKGKEGNIQHRASLDWRTDMDRVCAPGGHDEDQAPLSALIDTLSHSATAREMIATLGADKIVYDAQNHGAQYYPEKGLITLNPRRTRGDLLVQLSRELRRAEQHRAGALANPLDFGPDEAILLNRAQAADAFMAAVRIAWDLKLAGQDEAWNHLAGSPMSDVARAFEEKARTDFRSLNNGEAARAAYDSFFEDARLKPHDKRLIHQMLLDENAYVRGKSALRPPQTSLDLFRKLGQLPSGANYLTLKGAPAPDDARYTAVEDRSNANFLWFIKFERSFHEKEAQMMAEQVRLSAQIVDFAKWSLQRRDTTPAAQ